jgi:hypothetical protein
MSSLLVFDLAMAGQEARAALALEAHIHITTEMLERAQELVRGSFAIDAKVSNNHSGDGRAVWLRRGRSVLQSWRPRGGAGFTTGCCEGGCGICKVRVPSGTIG